METINYCLVVPSVNVEEGTTVWYDLMGYIRDLLKEKLYKGVSLDICSTDMYWKDSNLIYEYKAVPASARTMASYPHYHALIISANSLVKEGD
jgi:hypothetical protein